MYNVFNSVHQRKKQLQISSVLLTITQIIYTCDVNNINCTMSKILYNNSLKINI